MFEVMPDYRLAVHEAAQGIARVMDETQLRGASLIVHVQTHGAGYDTLGGHYLITSTDFRGKRNPTRKCDTLAGALVTIESLNSGSKNLWHVNSAGQRKLVCRY